MRFLSRLPPLREKVSWEAEVFSRTCFVILYECFKFCYPCFWSTDLDYGVSMKGEDDKFLGDQLLPKNFEEACKKVKVPLILRFQPGYDHSYFFIQSFIDDHISHHAKALKQIWADSCLQISVFLENLNVVGDLVLEFSWCFLITSVTLKAWYLGPWSDIQHLWGLNKSSRRC